MLATSGARAYDGRPRGRRRALARGRMPALSTDISTGTALKARREAALEHLDTFFGFSAARRTASRARASFGLCGKGGASSHAWRSSPAKDAVVARRWLRLST